ncbi:hypothetical protein Mapa_001385 [Marchantia paleacea]|nr:hypothetical protein Mapa_001385 [Marchantia paleacea]
MCLLNLSFLPRTIRLVSEHGNGPIRRSYGQHQPELTRCPRNAIHGRFMFCKNLSLRPLVLRSFFPDNHLSIVGTQIEN